MAALPLPYYIRVWIFYECEEPEISARKEILDDLGKNILHSSEAFLSRQNALMF